MLTTYNRSPPPNNDKIIVSVDVPVRTARSTRIVVNSPYKMTLNGRPTEATDASIIPEMAAVSSQHVANRNKRKYEMGSVRRFGTGFDGGFFVFDLQNS